MKVLLLVKVFHWRPWVIVHTFIWSSRDSQVKHGRPIHSSVEIPWVWPVGLGHTGHSPFQTLTLVTHPSSLILTLPALHCSLSLTGCVFYVQEWHSVFHNGSSANSLNIALISRTLLYSSLDRSNLLGSVYLGLVIIM